MHTVDSLHKLADFGIERVTLACGNFDGIHLGHQEIFATAVRRAKETNAVPVVLTFDPHPRRLLRPETAPGLIVSMPHRLSLIPQYGIEAAVVLEFTRDLASLSPRAFIDKLLAGPVDVTAVSTGKKWRFGHKAAGDVATLSEIGAELGFTVDPVEEIRDASNVISSTRVRESLATGDLTTCEQLLGRPYSVRGEVVRGHGFASKELGVPTANVACHGEQLPPLGVYLATASINDGPSQPAVCYLGESPTLDMPQQKTAVEVHFYDFDQDVYDQTVEVFFHKLVRPDEKFSDLAALKAQVQADVNNVRAMHRQP